MYAVLFSAFGSGLWTAWMPPQTLQAASEQADYIQAQQQEASVQIVPLEQPVRSVDLKV